MADILTQTVIYDSEDVYDTTDGSTFILESTNGASLAVSNLIAQSFSKATAVDVQDLFNIGQRVDQDPAVAALGATTVKSFDSTQYDLSGDYPPTAAFNELVSLYNILASNYNTKIQYELNNRWLNDYPTTTTS